MSTYKITDLPQLSETPADSDVLTIVDVSTDTSKKITVSDLISGNLSADNLAADNFQEGVFQYSGGTTYQLQPSLGSLAKVTFSGNTTFQVHPEWTSGESITLHINSNGFTASWPTVLWVGGSEPDLSSTTGIHLVNLWKIDADYYGAYCGEAS